MISGPSYPNLKSRFIVSRSAALVGAIILVVACGADAAELKVMASGGFTSAYRELAPKFEKVTGHTIVTAYGASMGNTPDSIPNRLQRGESTDVVILASSALDELVKNGKGVAVSSC